jgi:hypothetical protein
MATHHTTTVLGFKLLYTHTITTASRNIAGKQSQIMNSVRIPKLPITESFINLMPVMNSTATSIGIIINEGTKTINM